MEQGTELRKNDSRLESWLVSIFRMHMALAVCAGCRCIDVFVVSRLQILTCNQSSNEMDYGWRPCSSYIQSTCSNP